MIWKEYPWKKVYVAIKKFVTMLCIISAISFNSERTETMITNAAETFTYVNSTSTLNVSLATDGLSS